jgi:hypothetical protein
MKAKVRVQGREFTGEVTSVANRPESNWFSTAKKYVVQVTIDGTTEQLRPGFTAEVEIVVADLASVISVPVAAVIEQSGEFVCAVRTEEGFERRSVEIGLSNDQLVEVKQGLSPGDRVFLYPRGLLGDGPAKSSSADADGDEAAAGGETGGRGEGQRRGGGEGRGNGGGPPGGRGGQGGSQRGGSGEGQGRPSGSQPGQSPAGQAA